MMKSIFEQRPSLSADELKKYLEGSLSEAERFEVENRLLDCPLSAAAVEGLARSGQETVDGFMEDADVIRQQVKERAYAEARATSAGSPGRVVRLKWLGRAAAVALLLILGYALYEYQGYNQPVEMAYDYLYPPQSRYLAQRGAEGEVVSDNMRQAIRHYQEERYLASLPYFKSHLAQQPDDDDARLLWATALLENHRPQEAEQQMVILGADEVDAVWNLQWYLALVYLAQHREEAALPILKRVSNASPVYRKAAEAILEELDRPEEDDN